MARVRKIAEHEAETIVAQGEPDRFAESLRPALDRISWCSADPLCMEPEAGGVNGLHHAACHTCIPLPKRAAK
ncbi:hypothetical protein [Streptomyces sioyaensis]|uniref:hypothetical protein n=1 Tax=Streptomyces sioyaensis TaxID=67364 RepID=UPI003F5407EC